MRLHAEESYPEVTYLLWNTVVFIHTYVIMKPTPFSIFVSFL